MYLLVNMQKLLKMAIEIVDLLIYPSIAWGFSIVMLVYHRVLPTYDQKVTMWSSNLHLSNISQRGQPLGGLTIYLAPVQHGADEKFSQGYGAPVLPFNDEPGKSQFQAVAEAASAGKSKQNGKSVSSMTRWLCPVGCHGLKMSW